MNHVRPAGFTDDVECAAFLNDLKHAAVCCKVVEETLWNDSQGKVMERARREGADRVTAVSKLSGAACRQQIMVFEVKELGYSDSKVYIIAFRAGNASTEKSLDGGTSCSSHDGSQVREGVDQALWELAGSVPLQPLPPQWHLGLQERRVRLILTGFSVGGAVAAVTTLQLLENGEHDAVRNQIRCFTFGAPLQGGKSYADRVDRSLQKHFYHAIYQGDPIPGMLTLMKKVAKLDNDVSRNRLYISVLASICALAGIATSIAAAVVVPAAGAVATSLPCLAAALRVPASLDKLVADFKKLVSQQAESRDALPEYEFCGNLLLLIKDLDEEIKFGSRHGNLELLEKVFGAVPNNVSAQSLKIDSEDKTPEYTLEWYLQVIKKVHHKSPNFSASSSRIPAPNADVAEFPGCFPSRVRNNKWLLEPTLRRDNPVTVFLDRRGKNITVKVYGENIVFGIHVLYLEKDGDKNLLLPCTGSPWWDSLDASMSADPMTYLSSELAGLLFSAHLENNDFPFTDGFFKVELAFGALTKIPARPDQFRICSPMEDIHVAPRYAYLPPQELVELLITLAKVDALAICHAAFIAIHENRSNSRAITEATTREFHNDKSQCNECCKLLDCFLHLMSADQLNLHDREALPEEMQKALGNRRTEKEITRLYPKKEADETAPWTFCHFLKLTVQPMLSEEKLSSEKTAQELRKKLDEMLEFPHKVLRASLKSELEVKNFAKGFSFQSLKKWNEEKKKLITTSKSVALVSGSIPVVNVPLFLAPHYAPTDYLNLTRIAKYVGGLIGTPTALMGVGIFYSAWFLVHVACKPERMIRNKPGLVDDFMRTHRASSKASLDDWKTKLQAACLLFDPEFKEHVDHSCELEFRLYTKLRDSAFVECGCFDTGDEDSGIGITRHTLLVTLQVANFGYSGRWMHEARRYLTELPATVGLIGPVQAGKSTFAHLAFGVPTPNGTGMASRTRVMRRFSGLTDKSLNHQFAVIDFPGSTDVVGPDLYIRGLSFVCVLLVFMNMTDFTSTSGRDLILEAIKARRKNEAISALFCFTHADQAYDKYADEVDRCISRKTVQQLFEENWTVYKNALGTSLAGKGCIGDDWKYVHDNMHACNFRPTLQEQNLSSHQETIMAQRDSIGLRRQMNSLKAHDMKQMGIKNVEWVKNWCIESLARTS